MITSHRRTFLLSAIAVTMALAMGCDNKKEVAYNTPPPPYQGKYKNDKGQVVVEIMGSSLLYTDAQGQKVEIGYTRSGTDKLVVESSSGNFTLTYKDGTLKGLPSSIAKSTAPLKQDPPPAAQPAS